VILVMQN